MANCKCFRCGRGYDSGDPDDVAGDGRCLPCKELAKKIAIEVDLKMAAHRRTNPIPESPFKKFIESLPPDGQARINARDLGIFGP